MDKWDELHKKECLLLEQEDVLIQEKNQIQRVNEAIVFASVNPTSKIVLGGSANAWVSWKTNKMKRWIR